jgi:putative oxidoreductase
LAAAFLVAGTHETRRPANAGYFLEKIGLGRWFRYFTGGLEVIGAILVLVPRTAVVGAVVLGMTMVGAVDIHLLITGGRPVPSVVLLVIAVAVAWYRELYLKRRQY